MSEVIAARTFADTRVETALKESNWSLFVGGNGKFDLLSVDI